MTAAEQLYRSLKALTGKGGHLPSCNIALRVYTRPWCTDRCREVRDALARYEQREPEQLELTR